MNFYIGMNREKNLYKSYSIDASWRNQYLNICNLLYLNVSSSRDRQFFLGSITYHPKFGPGFFLNSNCWLSSSYIIMYHKNKWYIAGLKYNLHVFRSSYLIMWSVKCWIPSVRVHVSLTILQIYFLKSLNWLKTIFETWV